MSTFQDAKTQEGKKLIDKTQKALNVQTVRRFTMQSATTVKVSETFVNAHQDTNRAQHT